MALGGQGDESALVVAQDREQRENEETQVAKWMAPTLVGCYSAFEVRPDSVEIGELVDKLTLPGFDLDAEYLTGDRISDGRNVVVDVVMDAAGGLGGKIDDETVALLLDVSLQDFAVMLNIYDSALHREIRRLDGGGLVAHQQAELMTTLQGRLE